MLNFMPLASRDEAREGGKEKEGGAAKGGAKGGGRVLAKAASEDVQEPGTTARKHAGSQMRLIWIAGVLSSVRERRLKEGEWPITLPMDCPPVLAGRGVMRPGATVNTHR